MKFFYAPMEGITGYIYRNAHNAQFKGQIDRYYAPFIVADQTHTFKSKDRNDILPENNQGLTLIPQILTNNAADFIHTAKKIQQFGYNEINLNLGCPSGTVVSKKRGAGLLADRDALEALLDEVFSKAPTQVSIKTRLGIEAAEEFYPIIELYNQYPMTELIIHPRVQKDMYKNKPNMNMFKEALAISKHSICYNGDICTPQDYIDFTKAFPQIDKVMIGRGLLTNGGLVGEIKGLGKIDKAVLKAMHDQIYADYQAILFGEKNVLFKMKELWHYMGQAFTNPEKYQKKIRKSERLSDYEEAVHKLFNEQELQVNFGYKAFK